MSLIDSLLRWMRSDNESHSAADSLVNQKKICVYSFYFDSPRTSSSSPTFAVVFAAFWSKLPGGAEHTRLLTPHRMTPASEKLKKRGQKRGIQIPERPERFNVPAHNLIPVYYEEGGLRKVKPYQ